MCCSTVGGNQCNNAQCAVQSSRRLAITLQCNKVQCGIEKCKKSRCLAITVHLGLDDVELILGSTFTITITITITISINIRDDDDDYHPSLT